MAVRTATITLLNYAEVNAQYVVWTGVAGATTDTGSLVEIFGYSDKSVQVEGTFSGTTVVLQGSNDGVLFHTLTDPQGNDLSFTAAGLEQVMELTRYIRPSASAGTGSLTITVLAKMVK